MPHIVPRGEPKIKRRNELCEWKWGIPPILAVQRENYDKLLTIFEVPYFQSSPFCVVDSRVMCGALMFNEPLNVLIPQDFFV